MHDKVNHNKKEYLDLTGQKFGNLTVIELTEQKAKKGPRKRKIWICKCDCGKEVLVTTANLTRGHNKSCGCRKTSELKGYRQGMIEVLEYSGESHPKNGQIWNCKCSCGNKLQLTTQQIKRDKRMSCGCYRTSNNEDLTGVKFGRLLVIKRSNIPGEKIWQCLCDCGKTYYARTYHLSSGRIVSCGCYLKEKQWTGCGSISGCYWSRIISAANQRNLEFTITIEYAWELFLKQQGICALSGVEIEFAKTTLNYQMGLGTASLDRIDSSKGYIEGNVQWVHKQINISKLNLTDKEFIEMCSLVHNYQSEKKS